MYTSRDDARSDLFLSGAWYVFGPLVVGLLVSITRLDRIGGLGTVFALTFPLLFTVVVPLLLMRYRGESLSDIGLGGGGDSSVGLGFLAALPIVLAGIAAAVLGAGTLAAVSPLTAFPISDGSGIVSILAAALRWVGLLFLTMYGTVKARDAFGGDAVGLHDGIVRVGRYVGIVGCVAIVIIILAFFRSLDSGQVLSLLAYPVGVTIAVFLVGRGGQATSTTTIPTVLTAVILMAIGPFALTFNLTSLALIIYTASLFGGIGLVVAGIVERTQRGGGALVLGLLIGLLTRLGAGGAFGL
jgi:hypothetical protein